MKKRNHLSLIVVFTLVLSMVIQPMNAFAADTSTDVEAMVTAAEDAAYAEMNSDVNGGDGTMVQPRAHTSYYPSSGANSGWFHGAYSNTATYNYLPAGTMKFSYSMSGGDKCYLLFYRGPAISGAACWSQALNANDYTGTSSIALPDSGSYTVRVYFPNGTNNSTLIYAFNLYRD